MTPNGSAPTRLPDCPKCGKPMYDYHEPRLRFAEQTKPRLTPR